MNEHRKVWRIEKNSDFHLDGQAYSKLQGLFEFIEKEEPIGFLSEQKTQKEIAFQDTQLNKYVPNAVLIKNVRLILLHSDNFDPQKSKTILKFLIGATFST